MSGDRPRWTRPGWLILGTLLLVWGAYAAWPRIRAALQPGVAPVATGDSAPKLPALDDTLANAPTGTRVRVEVLNATTTRGLGRRGMFYLRDRGFDVVAVGTSRAGQDEVVVIDRSGHPEWAQRVARAMGGARVEARPDSSRYLDVTVVIGGAWRAPTEPFHP
ncbi:MAG: LytR C-terminal domain-containing protein [Gemmatirosa sp.]